MARVRYNRIVIEAYFRAYDLPEPVGEHRFHPVRKWRFDVAWPDQKVAMEVEGGAWTKGRHTRGKGFISDMEKYNTAALMGWLLLRVIPDDLLTLKTAEMVKEALESRGWSKGKIKPGRSIAR